MEEKAREIFEKELSAAASGIERCSVGHGNYVYIISSGADKYVLRCSDEDNAYADTVYWLDRLWRSNIPVPKVISSGKYKNVNYVILSYLPGKDLGLVYAALSKEEKRTIAREVVRIQQAVSAIQIDGVEEDWTWISFIQYMLDRARDRIAQNCYFDVSKVEYLREASGTLQNYFSQIQPKAYLDDISTKNLLIENGKVSGIIDVDWIGVGDKLTFAALTNVALLNMGLDTDYIDFLLEEMRITRAEKKAFIYYSLLFCVDFMGERGMQFGDKRIEANETVIRRLNQIYDELTTEWNRMDS